MPSATLVSSPASASKPPRKAPEATRRMPRQARSQQVFEAILTSAQKLVVRSGIRALTTNRIARTAGVSIGSLYQYFPSKRAILAELRRRHQSLGEQTFRAEAMKLYDQPVQVATRRFVEQMIAFHRVEPELHQALELEGRAGRYGDWERQAVELIRMYYQRHQRELAVSDLDLASFLVAVTTEAVTHAAVLERPDLLRDERLVDGLVRMLLGYLTADVSEEVPGSR